MIDDEIGNMQFLLWKIYSNELQILYADMCVKLENDHGDFFNIKYLYSTLWISLKDIT
jgi:hypothetical protein